ncbi:MAG: hypothetical protein U0271_32330 [Polyangiaceae bacterium]
MADLMWRRVLKSSAREAGAFARQAVLLPRDTLAPVVPRDVAAGDHVVVFLHGLFASAGVLRPMRQRVGRHPRIHTAAFSYLPGPGAQAIADRLDELLTLLPSAALIHLVGHSLGGIVARYHAVKASDPRIISTIALASPFGGVRGAKLLGFEGARDIDPDSPLLRELRLDATAHIPHLSIIAGADMVTRDPVAHALPSGELVVLPDLGHNTVLFDREAISLVERRVLEIRRKLETAHVSRTAAEGAEDAPQEPGGDPSSWPERKWVNRSF